MNINIKPKKGQCTMPTSLFLPVSLIASREESTFETALHWRILGLLAREVSGGIFSGVFTSLSPLGKIKLDQNALFCPQHLNKWAFFSKFMASLLHKTVAKVLKSVQKVWLKKFHVLSYSTLSAKSWKSDLSWSKKVFASICQYDEIHL